MNNAVRALLQRPDTKVDLANGEGHTALHMACNSGHLECVRMLLDAGADMNAGTARKFTPLTLASINGHFEIVELLIEAGATLEFAGKCDSEDGQLVKMGMFIIKDYNFVFTML